MNQYYIRQLRHFAEHNPKSATAALVAGTVASFAALVAFIEIRDRDDPRANPSRDRSAASSSTEVTPREARLAAMLENAKSSSWRQNLTNAADAQRRFMVPGQSAGAAGTDATPEYVKRIEERSEEILLQDRERLAKAKASEEDPSKTKFW